MIDSRMLNLILISTKCIQLFIQNNYIRSRMTYINQLKASLYTSESNFLLKQKYLNLPEKRKLFLSYLTNIAIEFILFMIPLTLSQRLLINLDVTYSFFSCFL